MKKLLHVLLILSFMFMSCQNAPYEQEPPPPVKDGVFIHISHGADNVHRVLMALQMAAIMAEDRDVLVYFDIRGIDVVLADGEDFTYSHFPSSQTQIQNLLAKNVPLMACPGCLKAAGKTEADMMEGIQVADKEQFFGFTKGRILTIDY